MSKIEEALSKLFTKYRIIFWYDENQEMVDQFNELNLAGVEKRVVKNDQFYIKYLVTKEKPNSQFLLCFPTEKPANSDNWLLDLELANYLFQTNKEALFAQELELEYHFTELIAEHIDFFRSKERIASLKILLGKDDGHQAIRYKMLAILFNTDNVSLISFLQVHASAFNDGNERYDRDLVRYNLKSFYWKEIARKYGYINESPTIYDLLIEFFQNNFSLGKKSSIAKESRILISIWKDTISYQQAYRDLSRKIASDIKVESILNHASVDVVIQDDLFDLIDKKIISDLANMICDETISNEKLNHLIKQRENKYGYHDFENFYLCLENGMQMINLIRKFNTTKIESLSDGVNNYVKSLFKIDYFYRKYIYHYRQAKQNRVLQPLSAKVEKVYSNDWLLAYGNEWQKVIDEANKWHTPSRNTQHTNTSSNYENSSIFGVSKFLHFS